MEPSGHAHHVFDVLSNSRSKAQMEGATVHGREAICVREKFWLLENSNTLAITAKCENGVLTVAVEKLPPPAKSKKVEAAIA
ncbi:hypothetical protein U1Q18_048170 [Sarracenia purpurea var. burkii]